MNIFSTLLALFIMSFQAVAQQGLFPLVTVEDTAGNIVGSTQKKYNTVLRLQKKLSLSNFVEETFRSSMAPLYEQFEGLLELREITNEEITRDVIQVSYQIVYVYAIFNGDSDVNDLEIMTKIGTFQSVYTYLQNSDTDLNSLFSLVDESSFSFKGESLCGVKDVCPGNSVCTEVLTGVTITCTSQCKLDYCINNGTCEQSDFNQLPLCTCPSTSNLWYLGARCETFIALWMLIVAIVSCFVIIIITLVFCCWVYQIKRRKKEKLAMSEYPNGVTNSGFIQNEDVNIQVNDEKPPLTNNDIVYTVSRDRSRRRRRDSSYSRRERRRRRHSSYSRGGRRRYRDDEERSRSRRRQNRSRSSSRHRRQNDDEEDKRSVSTAGANDVSLKEQGTSPIVWKVPDSTNSTLPKKKFDIAARRGWKPSLGPDMFNLGSQNSGLAQSSSSDISSSGTSPSQRIDDTDV